MRNFILLGDVIEATAASDYSTVDAGKYAIFVTDPDTGKPTNIKGDGSLIKGEANFVVGRSDANGGPLVFPFYNKDFSYNVGEYEAPTKFKASFYFPSATVPGTYTIIVVKKGKLFNERYKFTHDVYAPSASINIVTIKDKLINAINNNSIASGVKASFTAGTFTIEAIETGEDYEIVLADNLAGTAVTYTTTGSKGFGTYDHILDLANKAAADSGFNYTYDEGVTMYPNYPIDNKGTNTLIDEEFDILTMRFAEPRQVRTVDTVVHQIIQIAAVSGGACQDIAELLDAMMGKTTTEEEPPTGGGGGGVNPQDLVQD